MGFAPRSLAAVTLRLKEGRLSLRQDRTLCCLAHSAMGATAPVSKAQRAEGNATDDSEKYTDVEPVASDRHADVVSRTRRAVAGRESRVAEWK